jgi:plasmid maintenance system antidote protein VapI
MKHYEPPDFNPDWTSCPGDTIREWLEEHGKTQRWLAQKCRRPVEQLNRLIQGRIRLTERWAIELGRVTTVPDEFWIVREAQHRLGLAKGRKRL